MKYQYKIISSFDLTDIPVDREKDINSKPLDTYEIANIYGEASLKAMRLDPDQYYVKVYEVSTGPDQYDIDHIN